MSISISKIVLASFVSLLIAVALISVGVYAWQKNHPRQVACTMEAMLCPDGSYVSRTGPNCEFAKCPNTASGTADTSQWKTYRNEKYGFEVKYPAEWTPRENNKKSDYSSIDLSSPETEKELKKYLDAAKDSGGMGINIFPDIGIVAYKNLPTLARYELLDPIPKSVGEYIAQSSDIKLLNKFILDSYPAYEIIQEGPLVVSYEILVDKKGTFYILSFNKRQQKGELSLIEKNIFFTFKFIQ